MILDDITLIILMEKHLAVKPSKLNPKIYGGCPEQKGCLPI
jgi:hypothetical protein